MSEVKTVVVGMSGGVDSSVAAYLLKKEGYRVIGVTMQIWQDSSVCSLEEHGGCCGLSAVEDARRVAQLIGIPHYVMNFKAEFQDKVIDYFTEEYLRGRTPNPCIACNRYVKWESLLTRSLAIGADYIATGHYARVERLANGRYAIRNSATAAKDQTYALFNLTQGQLARTLMPVGDYDKPTIRRIAEEAGLPVAHKADSEDICFIPDHDYAAFLEKEAPDRIPVPGNFVLEDGRIVGKHRGISHYTIGQRKGLGIAWDSPLFVKEIRVDSNEVVLTSKEGVFTDHLTFDHVNQMAKECFRKGEEYIAKIRYSDPGCACRIEAVEKDRIRLTFPKAVRAVTPGQALVLYDGEYVAGGGTILN